MLAFEASKVALTWKMRGRNSYSISYRLMFFLGISLEFHWIFIAFHCFSEIFIKFLNWGRLAILSRFDAPWRPCSSMT